MHGEEELKVMDMLKEGKYGMEHIRKKDEAETI